MRAIRGKNTAPELVTRRILHGQGFRFRLHRRDLPGTPDIVMCRFRLAILVHGCFWHQHAGCRLARPPKANPAYWRPKFKRIATRDRSAWLVQWVDCPHADLEGLQPQDLDIGAGRQLLFAAISRVREARRNADNRGASVGKSGI
ncbi:MAG: very short patch repair endonuclease [Sciscionella sp.]